MYFDLEERCYKSIGGGTQCVYTVTLGEWAVSQVKSLNTLKDVLLAQEKMSRT